MKTVHVFVSGKVQGVFYRASAKKSADEIGVKGWVKNTKDARVEIMASGIEDQIEKFIDWCQIGPSGAQVSEVIVEEAEPLMFAAFDIKK